MAQSSASAQQVLPSDQQALNTFIWQAAAATWPFTAVTTILFVVRTVARLSQLKASGFYWDDLILTVSYALDIVRATSFQLALDASKKIVPTDQPNTVPNASFWIIFTDNLAFICILLPKLGIAFMLVRAFVPRKSVKIALLGTCAFLNLAGVAGFLMTWLQCSPAAGQWNPWKYPETHCWKQPIQIDYAITASSMSAALDLALALYPGLVLYRLQMPTWKKISTMAIMSLGIAASAIAFVKVDANTKLIETPTIDRQVINQLKIGMWNSIENDLVLSAAFLPYTPRVVQMIKTAFGKGRPAYTETTRPDLLYGGSRKTQSHALRSRDDVLWEDEKDDGFHARQSTSDACDSHGRSSSRVSVDRHVEVV